MRLYASIALCVFGSLALAGAQQPTFPGAKAITSEKLQAHLEFIASDLLEGRDTPSRGLDLAARYIASHLKQWGIKPAGDNGTYFQKFQLRRPAVKTSALTLAGKALTQSEGYYAWQVPGAASGQLVYVGFGWRIPVRRVDPYAGLDVKGKILVVQGGRPRSFGRAEANGPEGKGALDPYQMAVKLGAKGVLVLPSTDMAETFAQTAKQMTAPAQFGQPDFDDRASGVPVAVLSKGSAMELLAGERVTWEALERQMNTGTELSSFEFASSKSAKLQVTVDDNLLESQNVVAVLEGSDPVLKNEYVAVGAHYDHVGINNDPNAKDKVFNGADDDGSGTVATLAIAHAFAMGPKPKRSILFVWHAGEEKGLWGSDYFTRHPVVPLSSIITQLNIDMIGRSKTPGDTNPRNKDLASPNSVYVIGSRKLSDDLFAISEKTNKSYYGLDFDYKYDDPKDPEGFFFRSDHFNYARFGVPIIFYFTGVHEDYHGLGDEVEKIDFVGMEKITRTVYATAVNLANGAQRPRVVRKI